MATWRCLFSFCVASPFGHTQHGPNRRLHSCGTVSGQFSRGLPGPPTAPALPRAAATATAAGAAPPPCQLLGCNGDWAAAAEVTPAGERGQTCARGNCRESQLRGWLPGGRGGSLSASASFPADPRLPGAGARQAPGVSPERGGQAGQPWGR